MSRLRAMAARLRAASVYVQLCLMACRDRLVRLLLLLPVMLLPHTAMANTLFDMIKTVGDGARGSSSSFVAIGQVIGLVLFIGGLPAVNSGRRLPCRRTGTDGQRTENARSFSGFNQLIRKGTGKPVPSSHNEEDQTMSCELPPFTLLRTEHGNVIARDNRDNQEFVFAECYSTAIAALILAAVTLYTERKAYEKDPATHRPGPGTMAFPAPATGHGIQR